jgi:GNAT superfamily N-acetyltransferase
LLHPIPRELTSRAAEIFAAAMRADPLQLYFFPDAAQRPAQLLALYRYKVASALANLYAPTPGLEGCAIWIRPGEATGAGFGAGLLPDALRLFAVIPLAAFARMIRYERFAHRLHLRLMPGPHWYLDGIAVAPERQGQGWASRLIRPVLAQADAENRPCYLETQNPRNVAIYARFGFCLLRQVKLPGTPVEHFAMRRDAGN